MTKDQHVQDTTLTAITTSQFLNTVLLSAHVADMAMVLMYQAMLTIQLFGWVVLEGVSYLYNIRPLHPFLFGVILVFSLLVWLAGPFALAAFSSLAGKAASMELDVREEYSRIASSRNELAMYNIAMAILITVRLAMVYTAF